MPIDSVKAFLPNIYHVSSYRQTHIHILHLLLERHENFASFRQEP